MRDNLKAVECEVQSGKQKVKLHNVWDHDYAFPIFDDSFRPILPKLVKSSDNKRHIEQGKSDLEALADFLDSRVIKKKWC